MSTVEQNESITVIADDAASKARKFFLDGSAQLNALIVGEKEAKEMLLTAIIAGGEDKAAIATLGGDAGGSKTTLAKAVISLFSGIAPEDIVRIPVDPHLKPAQVGGGKVETPRERINEKNEVERWTERVYFDGLLKPTTKAIIWDEVEKGSEEILNSALEVAEEKQITTTAGTVILKDYLMSIMTQNGFDPLGSNSDIAHVLSPPLASRISAGAIMGDVTETPGLKSEQDEIIDAMLAGNRKSIKLEPIIDIETLKMIRKYASGITMSDTGAGLGRELIRRANRGLREQGIKEAYGRMAAQAGEGARALAAVKGEIIVDEALMAQAVKRIVTARLIARSFLSGDQITETVASILSI